MRTSSLILLASVLMQVYGLGEEDQLVRRSEPNLKRKPYSGSPGSGYLGDTENGQSDSPASPLTPTSDRKSVRTTINSSPASAQSRANSAPDTPVGHAANAQLTAYPLAGIPGTPVVHAANPLVQAGYATPVGQGIQMHTPMAPHQGIHLASASSDSSEGGATTGESDSDVSVGDFQLHVGPLVF